MNRSLFFIFLVFPFFIAAQNEVLFDKANEQYGEGNYREAIRLYEQILSEGETSVAVYYNLGNAFYKMDSIGPSIYYFEKALQLDPGDPDVLNNIAQAREETIDAIPVREEAGIRQAVKKFISVFSLNTWAISAVVFSFLFALLFLTYYFTKKPLVKRILFGGFVLLFLLLILAIFFSFEQQELQKSNSYAIVFSEEAAVRDEPTLREDTAFFLHEGTKAKVLEDYQEWVKVELSDGSQGWMRNEDLRKL